jgi:hypothetical protein
MSIINHTIEFNEIKDVGLLKTNTISDFARYTNGIINEINRADDTGIFAHFLMNNGTLELVQSSNIASIGLAGGILTVNFKTPSNRNEYVVLAQFRKIEPSFPRGHEKCHIYYRHAAADQIQLVAGENSSANTGAGDIDNAGIGYPRSIFQNTNGVARGQDFFSVIII